MATAAVGDGEGLSIANGEAKEPDQSTLEDTPMKVVGVDEATLEKAPIRPYSIQSAPGPPILHPTVTTWQWLFSASDLHHTPSVIHSGLTVEQERYNRWRGIQLIFRIAEYLRLGSHVMSTASIYFHRFFMRRAFAKDVRERTLDNFTFQEMAPTCVFLACKAEETYRKVNFIVEATMAVLDRTPQGLEMAEARSYRPDVQSREYSRWKEIVLLYEERLLETLCFDLIIEQPHPIAVKACKRLDTSRDMAQLTVVLLNALSYGAVSVFYDATTLAAGAFQKACEMVEVDPASFIDQSQANGSWYDVFDVDPEEVSEAMVDIEEQMAYHEERISQSRPTNLPTSLTSTTTPNTPLRIETETHASHQKHTHFASGDNDVEMKLEEGRGQQMADTDMQKTTRNFEQDEASFAAESFAIGQEDRKDVSRPMSRHGSKGASVGPPPPLGMSEDSSIDRQIEESVTIPEKVAAMKVHQEQLQQESVQQERGSEEERIERGEKRAGESQPGESLQQQVVQQQKMQPEEGEAEESEEEEGAL